MDRLQNFQCPIRLPMTPDFSATPGLLAEVRAAILEAALPFVSTVELTREQEVSWRFVACNWERQPVRTMPDDALEVVYPEPRTEAIVDGVLKWLRSIAPANEVVDPAADLKIAIEVFVSAWNDFAADAALTPDDRRTGDAYAAMAMEVAKCDDPDRGALRAVFGWFAAKADHFVDEFVGAAGKATGAAAGVGVGATVSGHLPDLVKAIEAVRHALGS